MSLFGLVRKIRYRGARRRHDSRGLIDESEGALDISGGRQDFCFGSEDIGGICHGRRQLTADEAYSVALLPGGRPDALT